MNTWIIAAVIVGILIVASVSVLALNSSTDTKAPVAVSKCSTCGNKCTAGSNCGSATCGAVKGTGTCGCGK